MVSQPIVKDILLAVFAAMLLEYKFMKRRSAPTARTVS
jgi:hypothetical protein